MLKICHSYVSPVVSSYSLLMLSPVSDIFSFRMSKCLSILFSGWSSSLFSDSSSSSSSSPSSCTISVLRPCNIFNFNSLSEIFFYSFSSAICLRRLYFRQTSCKGTFPAISLLFSLKLANESDRMKGIMGYANLESVNLGKSCLVKAN